MAFYFFVEAEISSSTVTCTSLLKLTTTTCSTEDRFFQIDELDSSLELPSYFAAKMAATVVPLHLIDKVSNVDNFLENIAYPMFSRPGSLNVIYPRFAGTPNFSWKKSKNALLYFSFAFGLMLSRLSCKFIKTMSNFLLHPKDLQCAY